MGAGKSQNFDQAFFNKYTTQKYYINRGASGNVYGPIQWNDMQLAIKQVTFAAGIDTEEFKKDINAKKKIWISLEHKNLIRIHSVELSQLPKVMFIVMEFAAGGSLHATLRSLGAEKQQLPIGVVTHCARQIAEGMLYLHDNGIVHRDLKSSNLLLMAPFDASNPCPMILKIADIDEVKRHDHTTTLSFVGTVAYMAPEVSTNQKFSKASDVWSYGVVVWEMLSGDTPHKGLDSVAMLSKAVNGQLDNLPIELWFEDEYKLLLKRCWEPTCNERPTFHDILSILRVHDNLADKYISDPVLIRTLRTTDGMETRKSITGMTILDEKLFVVSEKGSEIEVYDSIELSFKRRLHLNELIEPLDMVSCYRNKCLYIVDSKGIAQSKEILRVDSNGKLLMIWRIGGRGGYGLSVTYESNVIFADTFKHVLNEYSSHGELIREINLSVDGCINFPLHAIKLTNGNFVVSCILQDLDHEDQHRVCIVDAYGKLIKSFGGKCGPRNGEMKRPAYLSLDENEYIVIADESNRRILLLDINLKFKREILSQERHGLRQPSRIVLDESNGRMFVADCGKDHDGLVLIFQQNIEEHYAT